MSRTLTISAASGRIFPQRPARDPTGHLLSVDYSSSSTSQSQCTSVISTPSNEIYTSDSKGNITQIILSQNRYTQHIRNIYPCSFISNPIKDILALVHNKSLLIYNSTGKKLHELKQHYSTIKGIDINYSRNYFLTYSDENAVIYDINTWRVVRNMRTKGNSYTKVLFSPDGNSVVNGFSDGKVYRWRLSDNKLEQQFAFCDLSIFCISPDEAFLFGANEKAVIFIWDQKNTTQIFRQFEPIPGVSNILQMQATEQNLIILGNNGRLYCFSPTLSRVECELQVGIQYITSFSLNTNTLAFITNKGILYLYDFHEWYNQNIESRENKIKRGLEQELAYTYVTSSQPPGVEVFEVCSSQASLNSSEDIIFTKLNRNPEIQSNSTPNLSLISQNPACQHELFKKLFGIAKLTPHESQINHCKMKKILSVTNEYPEKFRPLIWRFMLQLPNNVDGFAGLYSRGTHPALINSFQKFSKTSQNEFSRTERITSALCYWSSLLSQVEYLHEIVNPFVSVYPGDDLSCFEVVMSLILHWMQHWFEFFPNPPVVLLESIVNVIKFHSPGLIKYLSEHVEVDKVIWTVLQNFLSKAVKKNDWLKIMDYLFTEWQNPEKIVYVVAAYFLRFERLILKLKGNQIFGFLNVGREINIKKFVEKVEEIWSNHGAPIACFNIKLPICQGQYPLFTAYPQYKVQTREELANEILAEMQEKEEIRRYNICLTEKVKSLESRQKDIIERAKSLGMDNDDIIEQYHSELVLKKNTLLTFTH